MPRIPVLLVVACCAFGPASEVRGQTVSALEAPEGLTATEWSGIRAAYEAGRHAARATDGGYRARNPGQRWTTHFDGRGFTTTPDAGGWSWGLELASHGRGGDRHPVTVPHAVTADGRRVAYDWDERLTEWWVNDARGLEHGYTLHARPAGTTGELTLDLTIRGDLEAAVRGDGRDVRFVDAEGGTVLTYSGLTVFDAQGRELAARFERLPGGLRLTVDDRGARYPLTIDPVAQQAYLKASNTASNDSFGIAVAASGDTAVVGAYLEDSSATGVDGNQGDDGAGGAGAAYVFVRHGTTWSQQAYLKASNTDAGDGFGGAVAVSGDTIVVGADRERSSATGVDGIGSIDSAPSAGAAYVFARSGTTWSQQAYLKASNTDALDFFGRSVAVSGDTVVVGANGEDSKATGVDGDQGDNSAFAAGAAYVFVRSGNTWSQQAYLKASNTEAGDQFGESVAVSGETAVVGAYRESSGATGVDGDQGDNSVWNSGAAYVFVRGGSGWSQQAYLKASNPGSGANGDWFGRPVSVCGETIVVGAANEDGAATGVDGDQGDDSAVDAGAAYVFVRDGTSWGQVAYLKASNTGPGDVFGFSVAVSGDTVLVGAPGEDGAATGVGGDQGDDSADNAGAAYVFDLDLPASPWTDLRSALAGTHGEPQLEGSGTLSAGDPVSLALTGARESATTYFVIGVTAVNLPFSGGTLVPGFAPPDGLFLVLATDADGELLLADTWPAGVPPGFEVYFQHWIDDPAGPFGLAASNALRGTTP